MKKTEKGEISKEEYGKALQKRVEADSEERANFKPPVDISVKYAVCNPDSCEEQVNVYGTYNIQPTANTVNDFPAIAQGTPAYMKERPLEFFRDGDEPNPASDTSDKHSI